MTDYKNLKLIATSSPHIRGSERTQTIMRDVIIAMVPALAYAILWHPRAGYDGGVCGWLYVL